MTIQIIQRMNIAAPAWDEVVTSSPDGWVFSLYDWQDLILNVRQWGLVDFSFGLQEDGKFVAVIPLQFNPYNDTISSSGWGGSGPVLSNKLIGKNRKRVIQLALNHCEAEAKRCNAALLDFSVSPVTKTSLQSLWGVNPFVFYGLQDCSELSQVIDLSYSEDQLWAEISADARRQIRIAREKGCVIKRLNWIESVDQYYELHCETYQRTGVEPHPKEYFGGIANYIAPKDYSVLWGAYSGDGEIQGYHNAAWFGEGGYYHTGCSTAQANQSGINYLLFWEAIMGAKSAGLRWYDCGAIFPNAKDSKQHGLTTFKTKFGGEAHRLFRSQLPIQKSGITPSTVSIRECLALLLKKGRTKLINKRMA